MGAENNQPDWDKIAEKFDIWLPQLAPVGDALLEALAVRPGDRVIDLASGTGEPALTLARRMRGRVDIIGVDAADGMVAVAQAKIINEALAGITFHAMPAERLIFDDETFDRALCRFGVMLFEEPLRGLTEMRRVLKTGGRFALAVWSTPDTMTTLYWSYQAFRERLPDDLRPPLARVTSLGGAGVLERLIAKAGFVEFRVERRRFDYEFASFDAYWDAVEASDILKAQFDALPASERAAVRDEVRRFASDFVCDGRLCVPHEYLLATGVK